MSLRTLLQWLSKDNINRVEETLIAQDKGLMKWYPPVETISLYCHMVFYQFSWGSQP